MAYGAAPAGDSLAHTIYIWPSSELIAKSWQWPASWLEAFEHAAGRLGLAVAFCVLDGLPLSDKQVTLRLSVGCLKFSIERRDGSIVIAVSEFTGPQLPGPDAPGPSGARQQPCSVGGLVLGLRGSRKYSRLVVFHGFMPPIPGSNILIPAASIFPPRVSEEALRDVRRGNYIAPDNQLSYLKVTAGRSISTLAAPNGPVAATQVNKKHRLARMPRRNTTTDPAHPVSNWVKLPNQANSATQRLKRTGLIIASSQIRILQFDKRKLHECPTKPRRSLFDNRHSQHLH